MKVVKENIIFLDPTLGSLVLLRSEIRKFVSELVSKQLQNRIIFSLDEIVTNVIEHGGILSLDQKIEIRILEYTDYLCFTVIDFGKPFDPTKYTGADSKQKLASGADGGFGLNAIKKVASLHYTRLVAENKNKLDLHFRKDNHG
ncbi:MAG: ATP-binding protein [Leptospira sp.]|nr:ATP-binding protein [Leptospira sp.]